MHNIEFLFNLKVRDKTKKRIEMIKETQRKLALLENVDVSKAKDFYLWLMKNSLLTFKFESAFTLRNFHQFPVVLQTVLQRKQKGRKIYKEYVMIFSYTSNIDASGEFLKSLYMKRWGIETQYRVARQFQAKTSSLSTGLRIFQKGLGCILTALWLRLSLISNRLKGKKNKKIDYDLPLDVKPKDKLEFTVSFVKRSICREQNYILGGPI